MNRTHMLQSTLSRALLVATLGGLALVGCKKDEPAPAPAPTVVETAPEPVAAPAATASISSIDLGTATGPDMKLSTTTSTFKPKDKFIVSVATGTSDPAASVPGKLTAKVTFANGAETMPVDEKTADFNFAGPGVTNFEFVKPDGWPVGKYKVEVSLDGAVAQSKDFEVTK